jgi:hypothetical protein
MANLLSKRTLTEQELVALSQYELRRAANKLSAEWTGKSYPDESSMPERWRREVSLVRDEMRRRGRQLPLFD